MNFESFDRPETDEYAAQAKAKWGRTDAYREFQQKTKDLIAKLQSFICQHCYTCTPQILRGLGQTYIAGDSMTENIDRAGGAGTAEFTNKAIELYTK